jgi:hypothetical protein
MPSAPQSAEAVHVGWLPHAELNQRACRSGDGVAPWSEDHRRTGAHGKGVIVALVGRYEAGVGERGLAAATRTGDEREDELRAGAREQAQGGLNLCLATCVAVTGLLAEAGRAQVGARPTADIEGPVLQIDGSDVSGNDDVPVRGIDPSDKCLGRGPWRRQWADPAGRSRRTRRPGRGWRSGAG